MPSSSSGVPNVILGAGLLSALGELAPNLGSSPKGPPAPPPPNSPQETPGPDYVNSYHVLTVSDDAAGGGTRANTYFFINLFIPAPHPSYNGGAIVSYTLRDRDGVFEDAETLSFVFGYTKWNQPPLRNQSDPGFANFHWDNSQNKGHWVPIY